MSPGEVGDVNKVADGGTVRRRPIPAEDGDRFPLPKGDLKGKGDDMKLGAMILAPLDRRPGGVKIAEAGTPDPIDPVHPVQNPLQNKLRFPVRAPGNDPLFLVDRFKNRGAKRIVEEVSRRGKDDLLTPILYHCLKKIKTVKNVIADIKEGLLHRLPD